MTKSQKPNDHHPFLLFLQDQKTAFLQACQLSSDQVALTALRTAYLGRKGSLIIAFKQLSIADKKHFSQPFEELKTQFTAALAKQAATFTTHLPNSEDFNATFATQFYQIHQQQQTAQVPLWQMWKGSSHPIFEIIADLHRFFTYWNFRFFHYPELTSVADNFTTLNIGANHPAQNLQDCFFVSKTHVLRTHTTNFTTYMLQKYYPQFATTSFFAYTIGNVYRNDTDDATHIPKFLQLDACLWGAELNLAKLKHFLTALVVFLFGTNVKMQFRANYFPFTEPSFEVDLQCRSCKTKTCRLCKGTGWIEILGAGIIHRNVLQNCQIIGHPIVLAFGIGIERLAMIKYQIADIRTLTQTLWVTGDTYAL